MIITIGAEPATRPEWFPPRPAQRVRWAPDSWSQIKDAQVHAARRHALEPHSHRGEARYRRLLRLIGTTRALHPAAGLRGRSACVPHMPRPWSRRWRS